MTLLYLSLLFHFFKMGVAAAARSNKKARVGNKATCYWPYCVYCGPEESTHTKASLETSF